MGAGYGISRYDSDGDWHGIYIMAFKDSFNKWEPIGGYAYEKIWRPLDDKDFRTGLGFTASVTARDNWKYIPIPAPLPLASIGYQRLTFERPTFPAPITTATCSSPGCAGSSKFPEFRKTARRRDKRNLSPPAASEEYPGALRRSHAVITGVLPL